MNYPILTRAKKHVQAQQWRLVMVALSKKALLLCILLTALYCPCDGSHYIKYHMSDYCDASHHHHSSPVMLQPHSNRSAILVKLKRETYRASMNCTISLQAPPQYGLMAFISKLKLRRLSSSRADKLEFISTNHTLLRMYGLNQEVTPRKTILTSPPHNQLDIHFSSESFPNSLAGKGFKIVVSLYTVTQGNNICDPKLGLILNCGNDICIDDMLECDGINNCRNNEDETKCDETSETKLSLMVFLITIIVMVLLMMMFLMKNKDKRKEIVRRMSRVCAANPILYVMENDDDDDDDEEDDDVERYEHELASGCQMNISTSLPASNSQAKIEIDDNDKQKKTEHFSREQRLSSVRSKLSLSLPKDIDKISKLPNEETVEVVMSNHKEPIVM